MKKNMTAAIGGFIVALLLVITILLSIGTDHTGPEITFAYDITFQEGQDINILLEGVSAFDSRDGDVTGNVMVDSLIVLSGNEFAKVTYSAKDNSNNITKASRIVGYEGSGRSIYSASSSELMGESEAQTVLQQQTVPSKLENTEPPVTETASLAENNQESVPEETGTENESTSALEETTSGRETESANTEQTTGQGAGTGNASAPVLTLSANEGTIKTGDYFNVTSYVSSITDDKDGREELYRRIGIDGSYDTGTAGTYTFKVYCIDNDRNLSNKESFTLHVVEE